MSLQEVAIHRRKATLPGVRQTIWLVVTALLGAIVVVGWPSIARLAEQGRLHAPNFALIAAAPLAIQMHVAAVAAALGLGAWLLIGRKGRTMHRVLGWVWTTFMVTAAASSLFIQTSGGISFLHAFSAWTLVAAPLGVVFARRHDVKRHRGTMTGLFLGGLVVAGAFAFLPGRLMWSVFFG